MIGMILTLLFWIGILMLFSIVCALIGMLAISFQLSKGHKGSIWITEIKKDKRDFIEKGI